MEKINISSDNAHNLEVFSQLLNKDTDSIINEALEDFFAKEQKKLLEKNLEDENSMTNLSYDEFWDDIDI